ncbi:MAG: universal stress protein [Deltaproteobacteria bacterium]|nr:universal stress protein [Deltaproteobacteria bacterium]
MYKKILVPLDGSELAECVLPHVKEITEQGRLGEITLLNVYRLEIAPELASHELDEFRRRLQAISARYLEGVRARLAKEGIQVKTISLGADRPARAIIDYASENGIELIVLANRGYTGLKKLMLGSIALKLLHGSHVPVLLVRAECHDGQVPNP